MNYLRYLKPISWKLLPLFLCFQSFAQTGSSSRPNILFLVADDAGTDFSAYGSRFVNTPSFDRIARNGILFANAFTPNAKCAPSRSCIMTGRNSWQLEAAANHVIYFPIEFKTYMEALSDAGYATGFTGKGYAPGKAFDEEGKPRQLLGREYAAHLKEAPTSGISRQDYTANFRDFLSQQEQQPWSFWIGFHEPHRPYEYGSGVRLGNKSVSMLGKVPAYFPDVDTVRNDLLDYAYEIEYMDHQVDSILTILEQRDQLNNTLIVYTSDHGMPFPRVKGNQYASANHVPMAIMWKDQLSKPGRIITDFVSFIDLAPTFLVAAGVKPNESGMHPMTGRSLLPLLQAGIDGQIDSSRNFILVGQERHDIGRPNDEGYPIRGLQTKGFLLLKNYEPDRWPVCNPETGYLNCDGSPTKTYILNQRRNGKTKRYWRLDFGHRPRFELYDLSQDPDCVHNLAANPRYLGLVTEMENKMESMLLAQGDLRMFGYGSIFEKYPVSELRNFYERFMSGEKFNLQWVNPTDFEHAPVEDY